MITIVEIIKGCATRIGGNFNYYRRHEFNEAIDDFKLPLVCLLEIETPGFTLDGNGLIKEYYPINIQFITAFEKDIDSTADQRACKRQEAYDMAKGFLAALYQTDLFDIPTRVQGLIINKAYDVTALGYEINLQLTAKDPNGLCLCQ